MGAGAVVLAVPLIATGRVRTLWKFYQAYGVAVAVGVAATGNLVELAPVTQWFSRRRATALAVLAAAAMAGMSLLEPGVAHPEGGVVGGMPPRCMVDVEAHVGGSGSSSRPTMTGSSATSP